MAEITPAVAADIRSVTSAFTLAAMALEASLGHIPGFGAAVEACARLSTAVSESAMPEDPVRGLDQAAIGSHEAMLCYQRAGFTRKEAFAITLTLIQANASATALQGLRGG